MGLPARDERPGLGERYGIAVNATSLVSDPGRDTPLDRIAEMGYARIGMATEAAGDDEARKEAELVPWLWRAAYGRDRSTSLVQACAGFAELLMIKPHFAEIERVDAGIVRRFAECVVQEWLSLRCQACGGGGWEEVTATGKRVRPSGRVRNAPKAICGKCRGSGKPKESMHLRLRVITSPQRKIREDEYSRLWRRQFTLARIRLKEISTKPRNHLHVARNSV
jgi:hypothetical protein